MLAFLLSDLSYLTRADMSPTDASLCSLGPNTVTEEGKFYRHCWGTWPEEVLADHMSSTVFVSQMLSFLSPFHITRNLILSEERSPRVVPVRLKRNHYWNQLCFPNNGLSYVFQLLGRIWQQSKLLYEPGLGSWG